MPTRSSRAGRPDGCVSIDGLSASQDMASYEVGGIRLTDCLSPERNDALEAMLTGRYSPFSEKSVEKFLLYPGGRIGSSPRNCYFSSIWNLACLGISRGTPLRDAVGILRALCDGRSSTNVQDIVDGLLPFRSAEHAAYRSSLSGRAAPPTVNPAITEDVLRVFAEEGVMEENAKRALSELIATGMLRQSVLRPEGPLFSYSDDRRHIVSKVLNWISENRRPASVPIIANASAFDPSIDMLTGRTVGVPAGTGRPA